MSTGAAASVKRKDFKTFALRETAECTTLARSGFKRHVYDLMNKAYRMGLHNGRLNIGLLVTKRKKKLPMSRAELWARERDGSWYPCAKGDHGAVRFEESP